MSGKIHIGTSGWHYQHWRGPFYPEELSDGEMLAYYTGRLQTVEINNTFYQLPEQETLATWARQGRDVYCYFDNDEQGYAVQNAIALEEMTGR
jgi:uncharacterized protein YecE (DUF72 family)